MHKRVEGPQEGRPLKTYIDNVYFPQVVLYDKITEIGYGHKIIKDHNITMVGGAQL